MPDIGQQPTIADLLALSLENERRAGAMYAVLAARFASHPPIAEFWQTMEKDEADHVQILKNVRRRLSSSTLASTADTDTWETVSGVHNYLKNDLLDDVHTLDDAYELAQVMELSEINSVFTLLVSQLSSDPDLSDFVRVMIREHHGRLLEFEGRFGDRQWRQSVNAEPVATGML